MNTTPPPPTARLTALLLLCLFAILPDIRADGLGPAQPKHVGVFQPVIQSVGTDTITVMTPKAKVLVSDGSTPNIKKYSLDQFTTIEADGLPAACSDLQPGMHVLVTAGTSPDVAASIVAHTIPPAATVKEPNTAKGKAHPPKKITSFQVLSVGKDRITIGMLGGEAAVAYMVTPATETYVDGKPGALSDIHAGMNITVNAADQTTAGTIHAESR